MSEYADTSWQGRLRDGLKDVVRRNHKKLPFKVLAGAAKTYLRAYYNENHYRFEHNGEKFVIDTVLGQRPAGPVVFDVGAHRGLWARSVVDSRNDAAVHCFEIAPALNGQLCEALRAYPQVRVNAVGLSDAEDVLELHFFPDAETTSSLHDPVLPKRWGFKEVAVAAKVITGDSYCERSRINRIDLLKIDTEGHDLKVLYGFRRMLEHEQIAAIQFEHGFVHIPASSLLYSFYQYLVPFGFIIGRLYPSSVAFKDYDLSEDEQFRMGNYVAVHESQPSIIEALKG